MLTKDMYFIAPNLALIVLLGSVSIKKIEASLQLILEQNSNILKTYAYFN